MTGPRRKRTPRDAMKSLRDAFRREFALNFRSARDLLRGAKLYDKAYELSCLIRILEQLRAQDSRRSFHLVRGTRVVFRGKGGTIQRGHWPYIEVRHSQVVDAELWVDIECTALSSAMSGLAPGTPPFGRAHELDIVIVEPGTSGRPMPQELLIGVEAKHRPFNKALLKELLGVRRETAFHSLGLGNNRFAWWASALMANPPSGIVLFCSHNSVRAYTDPADFWGLKMIEHPY